MPTTKKKVLMVEESEIDLNDPTETRMEADNIFFEPSITDIEADNIRDAIEENRFIWKLHFVSGTGLNTSFGNGSFFRAWPGTFANGSFSGYPAAFPITMPYDCKIKRMKLFFRSAAFDFNSTQGPIQMELEFRTHVYNGSSVYTRINIAFGSFQFSGTGTQDFIFDFEESDLTYLASLPESFDKGQIVGVRFVKSASGDRRINSLVDVLLDIEMVRI
jgi:hypothetical protein